MSGAKLGLDKWGRGVSYHWLIGVFVAHCLLVVGVLHGEARAFAWTGMDYNGWMDGIPGLSLGVLVA